jgi:hypothetical protein
MDLKKVIWEYMGRSKLARERDQGLENFLSSLAVTGFSKRNLFRGINILKSGPLRSKPC